MYLFIIGLDNHFQKLVSAKIQKAALFAIAMKGSKENYALILMNALQTIQTATKMLTASTQPEAINVDVTKAFMEKVGSVQGETAQRQIVRRIKPAFPQQP